VELVAPSLSLRLSWLQAREEWGHDVLPAGAGLHHDDDVDTISGFEIWLERLHQQAEASVPVDEGRVHATYWWIAERQMYLGAISLRHNLNDFLLNAGGHIGYGVRPSARRRGVATWALGAVLPNARNLGLGRVLVTCADDNLPSASAIERNGGVLEDIRPTELGLTRRYWISIGHQRNIGGHASSNAR
jgi:predicted acetyltransferase